MKKNNRYYSLLLSGGQLDFLSDNHSGINRMMCLSSLIGMAATEETAYKKKGFSTTVHIGQAVVSEIELSKRWKCNRKTVSKMLDRFKQMGLVSSQQGNRTSVHTILCVDTFFVDDKVVRNPYAKEKTPQDGYKADDGKPEDSGRSHGINSDSEDIFEGLTMESLLAETRKEDSACLDALREIGF